jgi:hypothetical protein
VHGVACTLAAAAAESADVVVHSQWIVVLFRVVYRHVGFEVD